MCNVLKTFDPKILMQLLFNLIMIVNINTSKIYQVKKKWKILENNKSLGY